MPSLNKLLSEIERIGDSPCKGCDLYDVCADHYLSCEQYYNFLVSYEKQDSYDGEKLPTHHWYAQCFDDKPKRKEIIEKYIDKEIHQKAKEIYESKKNAFYAETFTAIYKGIKKYGLHNKKRSYIARELTNKKIDYKQPIFKIFYEVDRSDFIDRWIFENIKSDFLKTYGRFAGYSVYNRDKYYKRYILANKLFYIPTNQLGIGKVYKLTNTTFKQKSNKSTDDIYFYLLLILLFVNKDLFKEYLETSFLGKVHFYKNLDKIKEFYEADNERTNTIQSCEDLFKEYSEGQVTHSERFVKDSG